TGVLDEELGPISIFPDQDNPLAFFSAWTGDLGMDSGIPQNVYRLETENLEQIGLAQLAPGDRWELENGYQVEFVSVKRFASFQIAYDPGRIWAFIGSILAMVGLMFGLFVTRRRIWLRLEGIGSSQNKIGLAGLTKQSEELLSRDLTWLVKKIRESEQR
ncbi:MAG: cytochrome c biogenesis protein ResB, partial [Candidatus Nanopelagicales bacterium]